MLVFIPALQQCFEILMSAMNYFSGLPGITSSNSFFASLQYTETTRAFTVFNREFSHNGYVSSLATIFFVSHPVTTLQLDLLR
jgi:hypothetical protein